MAKVAVCESLNGIFSSTRVQGGAIEVKKLDSAVGAKKVSVMGYSGLLIEVVHASKKPDSLKNPKYIDTRVSDVFPVKKSSFRCKMLDVAEKAKDAADTEKTVHTDSSRLLYTTSSTCFYSEKSNEEAPQDKDGPSYDLESSASFSKVRGQSFQKVDKCSKSTFLTIAELSSGRERLFLHHGQYGQSSKKAGYS